MNGIVEFTGGPLDGYEHPLPGPAEELAGTVGLEINQNVVRLLSGEGNGDDQIGWPTSIAVYRLVDFSAPPRYEFLVAVPPDALQPDGSHTPHLGASRISRR